MNNFFSNEDKKKLERFSRFLKSVGMGYAEIEMISDSDFGHLNYTGDIDFPETFINKWTIEIPEFILPVLDKVMKVAQSRYDELDMDVDISYERVEIQIIPDDKLVAVVFYGTYYEQEFVGFSWDEEDDGVKKIFDELSSEGRKNGNLIELSYDGGGDSGSVHDSFANGEPVDDYIQYWCIKKISEEFPGWENNEGGNGTFKFNLEERTIVLEHYYNVESTKDEILFSVHYD